MSAATALLLPQLPIVPARAQARAAAGTTTGAADRSSNLFTLLGDVRSVTRAPGGVLLRADHGSVLVESIAGIGVRVRVRFGPLPAGGFPTPRSLATGDAPLALGPAALRQAGDTVVLAAAAGVEVRASRHPLRLVVRDDAGHELLHESFGPGTFNGQLVHYVRDLPRHTLLRRRRVCERCGHAERRGVPVLEHGPAHNPR